MRIARGNYRLTCEIREQMVFQPRIRNHENGPLSLHHHPARISCLSVATGDGSDEFADERHLAR